MDLAPLLYVVRATKMPLLLLIRGLLLMISVIFVILVISPISRVDFLVILLLLSGPLPTRLKKSSPCFESLDACVRVMRTSILWLQSFLSLRYLALSHDHEYNN
jgi:hypothetical protein